MLRLSKHSEPRSCTISLPGSKSESNRALILRAISKNAVQIKNLSKAADTRVLEQALQSLNTTPEINVGPAGTAMRFLTAYLSTQPGRYVLTGSERMLERPIGPLVDALKSMGAEISYLQNPGYPPLQIEGGRCTGGRVRMPGNISSQFISALLLVAPALPEGLTLEIENALTSRPYVEMTLEMLSLCGISHHWEGHRIRIPNQNVRESEFYIEPDWSAASYWYSLAALSDGMSIQLPGLRAGSMQGDSQILQLMQRLGVSTSFVNGGILIEKSAKPEKDLHFDLIDSPDLAQTLVVCCSALALNASFSGLETLKIKETNRIRALQLELRKIGVEFVEREETYVLETSGLNYPPALKIDTYDDHRMAMAFAPLSMRTNLSIAQPEVVEKSYPDFWADLGKAGIRSHSENL